MKCKIIPSLFKLLKNSGDAIKNISVTQVYLCKKLLLPLTRMILKAIITKNNKSKHQNDIVILSTTINLSLIHI